MRCGSPMRRRGDGARRAAEKAKIPLRNLRHRQDIGSRPAGNLIKLRIENTAKRARAESARGCGGLVCVTALILSPLPFPDHTSDSRRSEHSTHPCQQLIRRTQQPAQPPDINPICSSTI